ncbi:hypothetical protein GALMADRAFT_136962 [Galerina marginata CBS 339.88]|uniref:Uncharacterized protein n=1 Tax=Galerina marginata (strain CBS 339.88) TaxID=685588 RepID=A0A067TDU0_GALM3|nr:hypothetical protein GALMADRAFT_136962 [Galerina marginata CBS 339.88]
MARSKKGCHVVQVISQMQDQTTVPGCRATAHDILCVLRASGVNVAILVNSARTTQVTQHLLYIIDICRIFGRLATTKFSGSLHCEAALGTLISTPINETHPQYSSLLAELQQFGRIIGTSKRCCPVCARLSLHLSQSHSLLTCKALEAWLADDPYTSRDRAHFGSK